MKLSNDSKLTGLAMDRAIAAASAAALLGDTTLIGLPP
jgi:hypothetical protein